MENIIDVTDENFHELVSAQKGVIIVDFWASWCSPCKMLAVQLHEVAEELKDSIKIFKIDVDSNSKLSQEFQIRGIPAVFLYKDGQKIDSFVGLKQKKDIIELIKKHM